MGEKKLRGIAKKREAVAKTVINIKGSNYISLPIWYCREFGIKAGDRLILIPGKILRIMQAEKGDG